MTDHAPTLYQSAPRDEAPQFVTGMRESMPNVCWRIIDGGKRCCILERGHDGGVHEPVSQSLETLSPAAMRCYRRINSALPPSDPTDPNDPSVALSTLMAILHSALTGGPRV